MMVPAWDGRVYACPFCKTQCQVAISSDQIAAGMALDLSNIDAFLSRLAAALWQGVQDRTRIEAHGQWVRSIQIDPDPYVYIVSRDPQNRAVAQHKKVVRGVALRTKTVPLDAWVDMLTDSLAAHANTNARAAWVLGQLGRAPR
jgi:hypothetical protein